MITKKVRLHILVMRIAIAVAAIIFILLFAVLNILATAQQRLSDRIYPNVYIDDVNFGQKTKQDVIHFFAKKNEGLKKLTFSIIYGGIPIATFSARSLNVHYNGSAIADRAFLIGRSSNAPSRLYQRIATVFGLQHFNFPVNLEYDSSKISEFIANQEEKYNHPAKNALFSFQNGRVTNFRAEEKGLRLESDKFLADFESKIKNLKTKNQNIPVILSSQIIEPEITLAKSNDFGIEELIAVGKSDFSHSIPGRIHNITLAASKFNGVLIPRNAVFSFNDTVGDISQTTGYEQAYIIKGGKTVLGDGGGVCQVSTTLFRAALLAGLPIVERTAHAYRVGYYENDSKPGFDATVFAPSVDLKIKNDTPAAILIQTEIDTENNLLYFKFYGKKDGRIATLSPVIISDLQQPPPTIYQDDPTLKKGITKQIDFAAWGSKVYFSYKVTRAGLTTFEKSFFSNYRPWQAIYLIGQAD